MAYIRKEISLVFLDFQVLTTWGKNEAVVHMAARSPIMVVTSNFTLQPSLILTCSKLFQGAQIIKGGELCHPGHSAKPLGQGQHILLAGGEVAEINKHIIKPHIPYFSEIRQ